MKKFLLGTTALFSLSVISEDAGASDGIKLSLGGFFRTAYMVTVDDDGDDEPGNDHNRDGLFPNAEIDFDGEATLDNGLTFGVHIELEAEQEEDQIGASYIFFHGDFGQIRIGNDDGALDGSCITPPGASPNFGAFSPDNWGANDSATSSGGALIVPSSNSVCEGVDGGGTKLVYYSPTWNGLSFAVSYTPDNSAGGDTNSGGHHGMGNRDDDSSQHDVSGYLSYSYEGEHWGLIWGGGASIEGRVDGDGVMNLDDEDRAKFYQTGLVVYFGGLSIGGAIEYYKDFGWSIDQDSDGWVAGGGISYNVDAWTVGLQYSHLDFNNTNGDDDDFDVTRDRVVATGQYAMGPGISLDASLSYTWIDVSGAVDNSDADKVDNYDAIEFGIGTSFEF